MNETYRVQARDSLDATGWNDLPGTVVANGTTASFVDNSTRAVNHRFYRVALVR